MTDSEYVACLEAELVRAPKPVVVTERNVLATYISVASEHRQAIEDARRVVAQRDKLRLVLSLPFTEALVAIDEAMRDLAGDVGMT